MRVSVSALFSLLAGGAALARASHLAAPAHDAPRRAVHGGAARRLVSERRDTSLEKRFSNARFTYFADGLGACGKTNSPSDFIVALNSAQYGNGEDCFKMITITIDGKSTQAQITDECPGCPYGGLDFSEGLFNYFAPDSVGVLTGDWEFGGGDPAPAPAPAPSPTPKPKPTPTSTWSPPPPPPTTSSTTETPSSTSTSTSSTSTSTSTSSSSSSSSESRSAAATTSSGAPDAKASATPAPAPAGTALAQFHQAFMQISGLAVAGVAQPAGSASA